MIDEAAVSCTEVTVLKVRIADNDDIAILLYSQLFAVRFPLFWRGTLGNDIRRTEKANAINSGGGRNV